VQATEISDVLSTTAARHHRNRPRRVKGVIGPNGAGKTTTIRMCLGLTAPDRGSIQALGLSMPRDALAIKAQLGVVSQFDTLDPDFTFEQVPTYFEYGPRRLPARAAS
jgi:ABC-type multidrug transport system ATPase subunit